VAVLGFIPSESPWIRRRGTDIDSASGNWHDPFLGIRAQIW